MCRLDRLLLENSTVDDLVFEPEPLAGHRDGSDERVGYRLVAVAGTLLPQSLRLAYVVGHPDAGVQYVYVVTWAGPDASEPDVTDVESELAARRLLFAELERQVESASS